MYIKVDRNVLLTPISKIVNITEKKSLMPILSNILIEFQKDKTVIYSTDLEVSAIGYTISASGEEQKIVVHGRKFLDILKELDNDPIELETSENSVTMKQKETKIVLGLQDPEEFPEVKKIKGFEEFVIEGGTLLEMMEKVSFAISMDETRYILTGMHMKGAEGIITMVGTDGYRMAQVQKEVRGLRGFKGITIPRRSIGELERVISEGDMINIAIGEKHVQFSTENMVVISRIIEGNFPDYENAVPINENIVTIDKDQFLKGLRKVSTIIGRSEPVKITIGPGVMEMEAISDIGQARELINVDYTGQRIELNFNGKFISDVITHIEGDKIVMKAPAAYGAVLYEGTIDEKYQNIVMPIRV